MLAEEQHVTLNSTRQSQVIVQRPIVQETGFRRHIPWLVPLIVLVGTAIALQAWQVDPSEPSHLGDPQQIGDPQQNRAPGDVVSRRRARRASGVIEDNSIVDVSEHSDDVNAARTIANPPNIEIPLSPFRAEDSDDDVEFDDMGFRIR